MPAPIERPLAPIEPSDCDPVEAALAGAISKAADAGRFDVLPTLVAELEARRNAKADPKVVRLDSARRDRERGQS